MSECTNCDLVATGVVVGCPNLLEEYECTKCKATYLLHRNFGLSTLTLEEYKDLYNKGLLDEKD